eukprot:698137-Rhodomonas_salina.3
MDLDATPPDVSQFVHHAPWRCETAERVACGSPGSRTTYASERSNWLIVCTPDEEKRKPPGS